MKVHYINILLFAVSLNILAYTHKKLSITPRHIQTTRLLCECELYMHNYDNDPEMKKLMQQFHDRTRQRFQEYDERLQEKRQICKDKCDKEIQKIILKDKIEKELTEKFSELHTDIHSDRIPTCICEKSLADKMEKGCSRCGGILATAIPELGSIGATALYALNTWNPLALKAAIAAANEAGMAAGIKAGDAAGMNVVIVQLGKWGINEFCSEIFESILKINHYSKLKDFASAIVAEHDKICNMSGTGGSSMCRPFDIKLGLFDATSNRPIALPPKDAIPKMINQLAGKAKTTADLIADEVSSETYSKIITKQTSLIEAEFNSSITSIYASIIAIVVIVLIMVIIYLILRYRRKKKMKKKLLYIKLLEE
ncbi:rifin [Plasmodium sp. gorilla clade G1]|nr:rifin [Plasmodium sp. gorilla clade G1]